MKHRSVVAALTAGLMSVALASPASAAPLVPTDKYEAVRAVAVWSDEVPGVPGVYTETYLRAVRMTSHGGYAYTTAQLERWTFRLFEDESRTTIGLQVGEGFGTTTLDLTTAARKAPKLARMSSVMTMTQVDPATWETVGAAWQQPVTATWSGVGEADFDRIVWRYREEDVKLRTKDRVITRDATVTSSLVAPGVLVMGQLLRVDSQAPYPPDV